MRSNLDYHFVLRFKLPESETDATSLCTRLADAGCTDALVGLGRSGILGMQFSRKAASAEEAIESAITEVLGAIPGATVLSRTEAPALA